MIYLVVENYSDGDSSSSRIIYATNNVDKATTVEIESENKHKKQIEKMNSIFKELNNKDFEDFTDEENKLYDEAANIQWNGWYSTNVKKIDIDTDISVYI